MPKSRMMGAGNACASLYKCDPNTPTGGGSKKQGLTSRVGLAAWSNRDIQIRSNGIGRFGLFYGNQLGGIGVGRSMFGGPYTHPGGVHTPLSQSSPPPSPPPFSPFAPGIQRTLVLTRPDDISTAQYTLTCTSIDESYWLLQGFGELDLSNIQHIRGVEDIQVGFNTYYYSVVYSEAGLLLPKNFLNWGDSFTNSFLQVNISFEEVDFTPVPVTVNEGSIETSTYYIANELVVYMSYPAPFSPIRSINLPIDPNGTSTCNALLFNTFQPNNPEQNNENQYFAFSPLVNYPIYTDFILCKFN